MTTKKRGRPLGEETLEKQRIEKMMREIPAHIPRLAAAEKAELEESFKNSQKIRHEILKKFKHGSWTPDQHAYNMESLGHESFEGYEQQVHDDEDRYNRLAKKIRSDAGAENKRKAKPRQDEVMKVNKSLIEKLNSSSTYNVHRIATMIHEQWKSMKPTNRLASEDKSMSCRGDGGEAVSVRTIERWLEQHVSTFDRLRKE
jgi:hypothetical protein